MKYLRILIILASLLFAFTRAEETSVKSGTAVNNATTAEKQTTEHSKVPVKSSGLCKKCICNLDAKILDCSNGALSKWFDTGDLEALKYGDIQFETIKLCNNSLEKVEVFPRIAVKHLHLNHNKIASIEKSAFKELTFLETLDLSSNELTSKTLLPEVFEGHYSPTEYEPLKNLKELNLAHNQLHTLNQDLFEHLTHLETLILSSNTFRIIDTLTETAFGILTNLKTLDLSYMELKELPDPLFNPIRDLETLILAGNLFDELPNDALMHAINLVSLNIDENPIVEISEEEDPFPSLPKLKTLSMSYMENLEKIGERAFSNLGNLTNLQLTNNPKLVKIDATAFARLHHNSTSITYPPLKELYLHNNNLATLDRELFERWDKITTIDIRNNPWKCDCDNSWLIHTLIAQIKENTAQLVSDVKCAVPAPWANLTLGELNEDGKSLRCADKYGNHPENDGGILIGLLIGIFVAVPLAIGGYLLFKRGCFGIFRSGNGNSVLYNRAQFQDDYQI